MKHSEASEASTVPGEASDMSSATRLRVSMCHGLHVLLGEPQLGLPVPELQA